MTSREEREKAEKNRKQLILVGQKLSQVPDNAKNMAINLSKNMKKEETINYFNTSAHKLFEKMLMLERKLNVSCDVKGYNFLFNKAVKINMKLPIDKFTLIILEYAPEIYSEDHDQILAIPVPDINVNVDNEFSIINSQMFKDTWKLLSKSDQDDLFDIITELTVYAHVYFMQCM